MHENQWVSEQLPDKVIRMTLNLTNAVLQFTKEADDVNILLITSKPDEDNRKFPTIRIANTDIAQRTTLEMARVYAESQVRELNELQNALNRLSTAPMFDTWVRSWSLNTMYTLNIGDSIELTCRKLKRRERAEMPVYVWEFNLYQKRKRTVCIKFSKVNPETALRKSVDFAISHVTRSIDYWNEIIQDLNDASRNQNNPPCQTQNETN